MQNSRRVWAVTAALAASFCIAQFANAEIIRDQTANWGGTAISATSCMTFVVSSTCTGKFLDARFKASGPASVVQWNGDDLTLVQATSVSGGSIEEWEIPNPTSGSHDLCVTTPGQPLITLVESSYCNVDTSNPIVKSIDWGNSNAISDTNSVDGAWLLTSLHHEGTSASCVSGNLLQTVAYDGANSYSGVGYCEQGPVGIGTVTQQISVTGGGTNWKGKMTIIRPAATAPPLNFPDFTIYMPRVSWAEPTSTGNGTATSVWEDRVNFVLGNATSSFPVCIAYNWFHTFDLLAALTAGDADPQAMNLRTNFGYNTSTYFVSATNTTYTTNFPGMLDAKTMIHDWANMLGWCLYGIEILWLIFHHKRDGKQEVEHD